MSNRMNYITTWW